MTAHPANDAEKRSRDPRRLLVAAAAALERGDHDNGMRLFEQARALAPEKPEVYLAGAQLLRAEGADDQARHFLRIALQQQPDRVDAALELAALEPDRKRAEAVLRRAHAQRPGDLDVLLALGELLQEAGRSAAAVEVLEQVVAERPPDARGRADSRARALQVARARDLQGEALLDLQRHDDALVQFDAAVRTRPPGQPPITSLVGQARAYLLGRRFVEAERVARRMLADLGDLRVNFTETGLGHELDTMEAGSNYLLAAALVGRRQLAAAYERFRAASNCTALCIVATAAEAAVQQRRGRYAAAWPRLANLLDVAQERAQRDGTLDALDMSVAVMAAIELGELQRAEGLIECAPADNEAVCATRASLALAWHDSWHADDREPDLLQQAIAHIERAAAHVDARTRRRGAVDPDAEAMLASLLLAVDDVGGAEARIRRGLELAPRHTTLLTARGIVRARDGNPARAAESFRAALREDPTDISLKVRLGHALLRLELLVQAEIEYREVLRRARGCIEAQAGLGQVLISLGDAGHPDAYAKAVDAFEEALRLAATMQDVPPLRQGSTRVDPAQRSALDYGRGLALARLYERRRDLRLLRRAHGAFERARASPRPHPHAERAARLTAVRLSDVHSLIEDVGRWLLLAISLLLLAGIQASFFAGWPSDDVGATTYGVLTPLLLGFVVVALTLPQMRSLRLAGLELQKTAEARIADFEPLGLMREDWLLDAQRPALASLSMPAGVGDERRAAHPPSDHAARRAAEAGQEALGRTPRDGAQSSAYQT